MAHRSKMISIVNISRTSTTLAMLVVVVMCVVALEVSGYRLPEQDSDTDEPVNFQWTTALRRFPYAKRVNSDHQMATMLAILNRRVGHGLDIQRIYELTHAMSTTPSAPPETPNVATTSSSVDSGNENAQDTHQRNFECNICLDTATDAVISMCGHLFCWSCLYQWMNTQRLQCLCPVCKAPISKERVIPLYGRGSSSQHDPRNTTPTPPRPQGRRSSGSGGVGDTHGAGGGFFGGGGMDDGGIRMSLGIGAFPFSMFTASFNVPGFSGTPASDRTSPGEAQRAQQIEGAEFVSNVFLCIAIVCIFWLLFI